MKPAWTCARAVIALFAVLPLSATAQGSSVAVFTHHPTAVASDRPEVFKQSGVSRLEASEPKQKVMCFWLSYGRQRYICGQDSLLEVKKKCDKIASAEVGEPVECSCTDDPEYIRESCD